MRQKQHIVAANKGHQSTLVFCQAGRVTLLTAILHASKRWRGQTSKSHSERRKNPARCCNFGSPAPLKRCTPLPLCQLLYDLAGAGLSLCLLMWNIRNQQAWSKSGLGTRQATQVHIVQATPV